jgi:hypothetical protein
MAKDAAGNDGPRVGRAARQQQDNSSQWVGEEPFRRREAQERGERVEQAPERHVLYWMPWVMLLDFSSVVMTWDNIEHGEHAHGSPSR